MFFSLCRTFSCRFGSLLCRILPPAWHSPETSRLLPPSLTTYCGVTVAREVTLPGEGTLSAFTDCHCFSSLLNIHTVLKLTGSNQKALQKCRHLPEEFQCRMNVATIFVYADKLFSYVKNTQGIQPPPGAF